MFDLDTPKAFLAYSKKYLASKLANLASGVWSYFSIPIIRATLSLLDSVFIFDGSRVSKRSATIVSFWFIIILTNLGCDLLPYWSIAVIDICLSTGE